MSSCWGKALGPLMHVCDLFLQSIVSFAFKKSLILVKSGESCSIFKLGKTTKQLKSTGLLQFGHCIDESPFSSGQIKDSTFFRTSRVCQVISVYSSQKTACPNSAWTGENLNQDTKL